jgi:hypothetical protein
MNDLERDLRTLLDEKAARAGAPMPDARLLRRARRRQLGTVLGGAAAALAVVAGAVVAVSAFAPSDRRTPAEPGDRLVTTTENGIAIQHPENWYVVDPTEVGIETSDDALPKLVLLLANWGPVTADVACPGLTDGGADGILMTVQEQPLVQDGPPWPADLEPLDTHGLGQTEIGPSGCFGGWTLMTAIWTDSGRTFEAFVGHGPDVSDEDRSALEAAFASMRFAPSEGGPAAVRIATGTAGGEDWELVAEAGGSGSLELSLQYASGGAGTGFSNEPPDPEDLEFSTMILGGGDEREVVVFGATGSLIVRLEAVPVGGSSPVSTEVVDVPNEIGGDRDAFVLAYRPNLPELGATITAYDAAGSVVATDTVTPHPEPTEPITLPEGIEIAHGDDWRLRIDDRSGLCLTILTGSESEGSCTDTWDQQIGTAEVFPISDDRAIVYGFLTSAADRVWIDGRDGSTVESATIAAPEGFAYDVVVYAVEIQDVAGLGRITARDDTGAAIGFADFEWWPPEDPNVLSSFTPTPAP